MDGFSGTAPTAGLEEFSVKLIPVGNVWLIVAVNWVVWPTPAKGDDGASMIVGFGKTVNVWVVTCPQSWLLMVIEPVVAPAGTVVAICVSLITLNVAGMLLENFTAFTLVKFVPVMVTVAPTTPLAGLMPDTVIQETACVMVNV